MIVEVIGESDKFLTMCTIQEDGTVKEFKKKKPVDLKPILKSATCSYDFWITEPFKHQKEFLKWAEVHDNLLLRDEPGLGKTKQTLDLIMNRRKCGQIKRALIVCGVGGLQYNWLREVSKHTDLKGYILGTRPANKLGTKTKIGSNVDKIADLKSSRADILICNIEFLRNEEAVHQLQLMIARQDIGMVAVDECHKCKNQKAAQTKGLFGLHPPYKMGLTGTPIVNNPLDIYGLSVWLRQERRSLSKFKEDYAIMGGFKNKEIVGWKNLPELGRRIDLWSLRRVKEQCVDLPPKMITDVHIQMTPEQESLYKEVLKDIRDRKEEILTSPDPTSRFIGLRHVTGAPVEVLPDFDPEKCSKAVELLRRVQEALDNNRKVVIMVWYVSTLKFLNKLLYSYNIHPALIYGEMSLEMRNTNEQAFQNIDDCKVILGNYQTMGTGIELTAASVLIEYEQPWTAADEIQGQDRCHRIGQSKSLTVLRLITDNTVDERVNELITIKSDIVEEVNEKKRKKDFIEKILNDTF